VPEKLRDAVDCFLWENVSWGWEESQEADGEVSVYCTEREQARSLAERLQQAFPGVSAVVSRERSRQWHHVWRDFFQPVSVAGTFLILPSWEEPSAGTADLHPLFVYPEMAFGTGHHPTTHLCLEAIAGLRAEGRLTPAQRCLDLGTGSGILGIACAASGAWTLGVDNDRIALHNARTNRSLNGAEERFVLAAGDMDCLRPGRPFDLILANILAEPLLGMAGSLAGMLAHGGRLVLSGLLHSQEAEVSGAYCRAGLRGPEVLRRQEWSALIWHKD
jgi:ribosomal protein L11 methyltransferase